MGKLTTKNGMLWVQPNGPNTQLYPLACHDLGDLTEAEGGIELLRCWKQDRSGWDVVGQTETPPDPVKFSVELMTEKARDWLEKVTCPFGMYWTQSDCGPVDEFSNYVTGGVIQHVRRAQKTRSGVVHHEEDQPTKLAVDLEAWPPVLDMDELAVDRLTTTSALAANDVYANGDRRCEGDCGAAIDPGQYLVIPSDSAVGPATADVLFSSDAGVTIAAGATDPFGAGFNVMATTRFPISRTGYRVIAGREGTGAVQGQMAYSDDNGATWTVVSIGGAGVGHGPTYGHGLYSFDRYNIWLASADGYIYKSSDGGATWVAKEAGVIHAADNHFISFADKTYGLAGGAAGVISLTNDGGETWIAGGIPAASPARCGQRLDRNRCWVGLDNGSLYYSNDGGMTWTARTGFPAGAIRSLHFANVYQGFLLHNTAAPVGTVYHTNNGGWTWEALTTPTNNGLNSVYALDGHTAYAVGEVVGAATACILKIGRAL